MGRAVVLLIAVALLLPTAAGAASLATKAKRAVRAEVHDTFPDTGAVTVGCRRTAKHKFVCNWWSEDIQNGQTDYFGRARVTVSKYGGDARLFHVRCSYCVDGLPPKNLL